MAKSNFCHFANGVSAIQLIFTSFNMPGFTRNERLKSKVLIDQLFAHGQSFFVYPFKVIWQSTGSNINSPAQILISVPGRNFKHAVIRNLLKRRIREIYRKNKAEFYQNLEQLNSRCLFALIYTGREVMKSSDLEPKIILILQRLIGENVKSTG